MVIKCVWLLLLVFHNNVEAQMKIFDVNQYGGIADGKTDNSKAFLDAWYAACNNTGGGVVLFQKGIYLVNPLVIKGSCKGPMELQIQGTLLASREKQYSVDIDHWILFQYIDSFVISGGGTLDGQGAASWPYNDCSRNTHCKPLPGSLKFDFANNTRIDNITSLNSKNVHINLYACLNVIISNVNISAPGDSPNTDGIKIGNSSNIQIYDSVIATGDDCVAFLPESRNISVTHTHCGPGHGISLGSISGSSISDLNVTQCSFVGTQNGLRIKTTSPSQPGIVSTVKFEHIEMHKVHNPIVIDQQYCSGSGCTGPVTKIISEIQITDVKYNDIWGTSETDVAVTLNCSENKPCEKIVLQDINLDYIGRGSTKASCLNAKGVAYGKEKPNSCLQS
ncbi:exopolygalacturonase-like [Argentina anserina]|uniref:exopolygalacturonase-like n=1 Tax=Argentina anserina TaxID=57926 RepID=UPI00217635F1|nr:exopolygalacturonase-like [Potentilla anserina]